MKVPSMTPAAPRRRSASYLLVTGVLALVIVLSATLLILTAQAQQRLSILREGQDNGAAQRGAQTKVTCALWTALSHQAETRDLPDHIRASAEQVCAPYQ